MISGRRGMGIASREQWVFLIFVCTIGLGALLCGSGSYYPADVRTDDFLHELSKIELNMLLPLVGFFGILHFYLLVLLKLLSSLPLLFLLLLVIGC
jgi:hypothetical protein